MESAFVCITCLRNWDRGRRRTEKGEDTLLVKEAAVGLECGDRNPDRVLGHVQDSKADKHHSTDDSLSSEASLEVFKNLTS